MKYGFRVILLCGLAFWSGLAISAQETVELRFLCFSEGNECEVYADLLARFSQANPGITVAVEALDRTELEAQLSEQVEAGAPPDMARIADLDAFAGRYLDLRSLLEDPASLRASFPDAVFRSMSGGLQDVGLYGYPDAAAVVAPFINVSLFEAAGVALPSAGIDWVRCVVVLNYWTRKSGC